MGKHESFLILDVTTMTNLQIVQELYRAFREKDYDAFLNLCTSDLVWIQNEGFPQGTTIAFLVKDRENQNPLTLLIVLSESVRCSNG
jgi:ketosteroid isomerase-like protein